MSGRSRQRARGAAAIVLVVGFVGFGVAPEPAAGLGGDTEVRFLHAGADAPPVDVYVDDERVVENLSFANVSEYVTTGAGNHSVTVTATGSDTETILETNVTVVTGNYTVAIVGSTVENGSTALDVVPIRENATAVGPNHSAVRLVHFSPDAPAITVSLDNGTTLASNVAYGNVTEYVVLPSGDTTFSVSRANGLLDIEVASFDVSLPGESVRTGYAVGYVAPPGGAGSKPLQLVVTDDRAIEDSDTRDVTAPPPTAGC